MFYTFFDVETPNRHNDRVCSIGVVVTDDIGTIVEKKYHLVNPECGFDDMNMRIHGITPVDIRRAKTFPELWDESLSDLFPVDGVVAHNASFDLSVMAKTFVGYGTKMPRTNYACTLQMSRRLPEISGGKLPDVCRSLGFSMNEHHRADSDADACMRVFWSIVNRDGEFPQFDEYIPVEAMNERGRCAPRAFSDKTKAMQYLLPMMKTVISDGEVSALEAQVVLEFITTHDELSSDESLVPIVAMLQNAIFDGWIDSSESCELVEQLSHIVSPTSKVDGGISFDGRNFVLTGTFEHGSKQSVGDYITVHGGNLLNSVTKKCDYVIIGGCGSDAYSLGSYGSKVKKALDWQAKGIPIEVIRECDLYND